MKNAFSQYHPLVQFLYFSAVLLFTMCIMHPVCIGTSFLTSVCYALYLGRRKILSVMFRFLLPMSVFIALCNPLFNHAGITILAYFPDGNPLTLESLFFGLAAGVMFSSILLWCICLQYNLSSDRVIYLFSRVSSKMGLLLSMILRFIPKLTAQFRKIRMAQHGIGRDLNQGNLWKRTRNAVRIVSVLLQWVLENAIDTADSLKSRGYGLPHRTSFSLFRFDKRDALTTVVLVLICTVLIAAGLSDGLSCDYFPSFEIPENGALQWLSYSLYALLCLLPLYLDRKEVRKWNVIRSRN